MGCNSLKMVCNRILYSVHLSCPEMTKKSTVCNAKTSKITHDLLYKNCQKLFYFCGRILAKKICSWKVYEVFHVCLSVLSRFLARATKGTLLYGSLCSLVHACVCTYVSIFWRRGVTSYVIAWAT